MRNQTISSSGGWDVFVAKISSQGDWMWVQAAGDNSEDRSHTIVVDSQGSIYIAGEFYSAISLGNLYVNGGVNPNRMRAVPDVGHENVYTTAVEQQGKELQAPNIGSDKVDPTWQG